MIPTVPVIVCFKDSSIHLSIHPPVPCPFHFHPSTHSIPFPFQFHPCSIHPPSIITDHGVDNSLLYEPHGRGGEQMSSPLIRTYEDGILRPHRQHGQITTNILNIHLSTPSLHFAVIFTSRKRQAFMDVAEEVKMDVEIEMELSWSWRDTSPPEMLCHAMPSSRPASGPAFGSNTREGKEGGRTTPS